ncbi:MAG: surface-adhesin E family protein [Duganella sp.]
MNKSALAVVTAILVAAAGYAQAAQWARVAGGGNAGNVYYIDRASVIKKDKTRKVWSLHSFSQAQNSPEGKPYRSVKALHLYSCEDRTTILLSQVFFPEPMGKGEALENYKYEKFTAEDIVPDSPYDNALAVVCKP